MARTGADLALLLLGGFRSLVDATSAELSRRGYADVSPTHEFAMRSIAAGAGSASELGRRLSVSKQAAAKTIASLEERGYVARAHDTVDARRMKIAVTPLGFEAMRQGEAILEDLRHQWEIKIGSEEVLRLEEILVKLLGASALHLDSPGRLTEDFGKS
jgi:DNA-binding MarR family transcriptional regulator